MPNQDLVILNFKLNIDRKDISQINLSYLVILLEEELFIDEYLFKENIYDKIHREILQH
jgi:hypothetical protein